MRRSKKSATIPFEILWPICEAARACHEALERLEVLAVRGMKRGEQTSPEVATIAAKVLAIDVTGPEPGIVLVGGGKKIWIGWRDIRALAASCLTQAADKPKRNKIVRGLEAAIDHATGHNPGKVTRIKVRKP